jgi:hypothetical protein
MSDRFVENTAYVAAKGNIFYFFGVLAHVTGAFTPYVTLALPFSSARRRCFTGQSLYLTDDNGSFQILVYIIVTAVLAVFFQSGNHSTFEM